jgi:hypothetical protein
VHVSDARHAQRAATKGGERVSANVLFDYAPTPRVRGVYRPFLSAVENRKGVLDIDTVKGCTLGMRAYPEGGCYGECYAYKNAVTYGWDFRTSVSRKFMGHPMNGFRHLDTINKILQSNAATWYRVGTVGDPCHDWKNTIAVCKALSPMRKTPVIITKHWIELTDEQMLELKMVGAVVNTSTSGMDTEDEIAHRVTQINRLKWFCVRSVCRVVTCNYGTSQWARECKEKQDYLLSLTPTIDNPLRARRSNPHVVNGDILLTRMDGSVGGGKYVSLNCKNTYLGTCKGCPDQCGIDPATVSNPREKESTKMQQAPMFIEKVEFIPVYDRSAE